MQSGMSATLSRKRKFGQLEIGDVFLYDGHLYRKESELSALLMRWAGEDQEVTELVSHRFFPEIIVELPSDQDRAGSSSASVEVDCGSNI